MGTTTTTTTSTTTTTTTTRTTTTSTAAITGPGITVINGYAILEGRGYKMFAAARSTAADAETACVADHVNGHLASPVDATEFNALQNFLAEYSGVDVMWLGGSIDVSAPSLTYTSGRADASFALSGGAFQQPPFAAAEPSANGCTLLQIRDGAGVETGVLSSLACSTLRAFVCEVAEANLAG